MWAINQYRYVDLTQSKQWLSPSQRKALSDIIVVSFAHVEPGEYLLKYFDGHGAYQRKLRLYLYHEMVVGYCLLTFSDISNYTVIRASAAFLPEHRKGGNTFLFSTKESFKSWFARPWRKHFYADTMLSPAMYRAIAKSTAIVWPHPTHQAPVALFERFNSDGQYNNDNSVRCLVQVDRVSNYSDDDIAMFRSSTKDEIRYYCQINPNFDKGVALFVIIPINLVQFIKTLIKNFNRR